MLFSGIESCILAFEGFLVCMTHGRFIALGSGFEESRSGIACAGIMTTRAFPPNKNESLIQVVISEQIKTIRRNFRGGMFVL
jgi:hypothetical protein